MIPKIAVLSDEVVTRIAAGEVVERPASVVKELIENAIDAGCGRVVVEVEEAGRRLIRVTDDGHGMAPAEAALAFLRHSTSKIRSEIDLYSLRTMGFRGEALPSIAAVSRVRLVTVAAGAAWGTELRLEGGTLREERETVAVPGTMVEVADLFYNTPARRKFLKSTATEFGHICQVVQRQALAFPSIQFRLLHHGALVSDYAAVRSLRERAQQVYGAALVDASIDVEARVGDLCLEGLCCRPLEATLAKTPQDIFVNHRWVKSPTVQHAVYEGYGSYLSKGHQPRFVLVLSVDPRHVDVNVHPTKREVRFSDQERVHTLIQARVRALISSESSAFRQTIRPGGGPADAPPEPFSVPQASPGMLPGATGSPEYVLSDGPPLISGTAEPAQPYIFSGRQEVRPMGQIAERYILAQVADELQIVDQHTAHERILYERLCVQLEQGPVHSQPSLLPQMVEFSASGAVLVRAHLAELQRLGFDLEEFGVQTFLVRALPALAGPVDPTSLLQALVDEWETETSAPSVRERYHALLALVACHSAVRAGRRLELPEMSQLVADWRDAGFPATCPHGRRIAMRLTIDELDRIFGRQGWT